MRTYRESILKLALPDLDAGEETAPLVGELGHLSPDGLGQLVPVLTLPGHWQEEKVMIVSARNSYYRALCGLNGCIYSIRSAPVAPLAPVAIQIARMVDLPSPLHPHILPHITYLQVLGSVLRIVQNEKPEETQDKNAKFCLHHGDIIWCLSGAVVHCKSYLSHFITFARSPELTVTV